MTIQDPPAGPAVPPDPPGAPMPPIGSPDDFSGTNTEKIDKLIVAVVELRALVRLCFYVIGIVLGITVPLGVTLLTFLVVKVYESSAKLDRLSDQIVVLQRDQAELKNRVDRMEGGAGKR